MRFYVGDYLPKKIYKWRLPAIKQWQVFSKIQSTTDSPTNHNMDSEYIKKVQEIAVEESPGILQMCY